MPDAIVIVGASLAGAKAADELRELGFSGRVVLVGEESALPYERPPLSKSFLRGESTLEQATVYDAAHYAARDIELLLETSATSLDPAQHRVALSDGSALAYDALLLATGAAPRRLDVPGADLPEVRYLRRAPDADAIRALAAGGPVVVIGAGWIGSEVAASLRQLGADVTIVDPGQVPLERVMGLQVGATFASLHEEHGVKLHPGTGVAAIRGSGRVEEVALTDGITLPAAGVVVGIGVTPRTELAVGAGLEVDNGVVTDAALRTSADDVFAAGDVASSLHPLYDTHLRLEHWSAALNQGPVAAQNMLGASVAYDKTPFFFSDQYDFGMEYRGWAPSFDRVVFRGDVATRTFVSFWLTDGRVVAAMNANVWDQGDALERLVRARARVDTSRLADEDVALDELVTTQGGSG